MTIILTASVDLHSHMKLPPHSRSPLSVLLMTAVLMFHSPLSNGQQTISVNVKVVNVLASVRDRDGRIVTNLTKDDFVVQEDNRLQAIKYFSQQVDLPLSLGLLIDTSISERRMLEQERMASYAFLQQMVQPERDAAFIMHFDSEAEVLQDFTASREKLQAGLGKLRQGDGRAARWPERNCGFRATLLYEALVSASKKMRQREGRKALIVFSDGADVGSCERLENAIEFAQRADTVVYSIFFRDEAEYQRGLADFERRRRSRQGAHREPPDGRKLLHRISEETGGRFFVADFGTLGEIYASIQQELRKQYSLGYTSDKPAGPPGYRKIRVTMKHANLLVRTRDGYYAE